MAKKYIFFRVFILICLTRISFAQEAVPDMPGVESSDLGQDNIPAATLDDSSLDKQASSSDSQQVLEINQLDNNEYSIELRNVELADFFRVVAHRYNYNFIIDERLKKNKITVSLSNVSLQEAMEQLAQMYNIELKKKGNIIFLQPHFISQVFQLNHIEVKDLLNSGSQQTSQSEQDVASEEQGTNSDRRKKATIYDLLSDEGKIFAGSQPNSVLVIDYPKNVELIRQYIEMVDKGMQVHIFKLKYINAKDLIEPLKTEDNSLNNNVDSSLNSGSGSENVPQ